MLRPISFFDLESTSANRQTARIVEIAFVKTNLDGTRREFHSLVNPEIPIPPEASAIHGIDDEMVKDAPKLKDIIPQLIPFIEGCDIGGFNSNNYDIPLLYNELLRCGYTWNLEGVAFVDSCTIFKRKEERTLSAAVRFYLDMDHEGAHGALADVNATIDVFIAQLKSYGDIRDLDMQQLSLYCNYDRPRCDLSGNFSIDAEGDYIFTFGKHKDKKAKSEPDYLLWMIGGDFMPDTKQIAKNILDILKPKKQS